MVSFSAETQAVEKVKNLSLITGGVRSGKSSLAETLANEHKTPIYYLATMPRIIGDKEQDDRIDRHRSRRPSEWITVECPHSLVTVIDELPDEKPICCLVDCLSLFVTNLMLADRDLKDPYSTETLVLGSAEATLRAMERKSNAHFIVVTNEVGFGIVPETSLGRAFRDFLGLANQRFAHQAETVWLTCAGLPLRLKPAAPPFG